MSSSKGEFANYGRIEGWKFIANFSVGGYGVRGVVIRREENKITFTNPGYVRTGKKQMRLGGESDPRNKSLMKMFNLINIGEHAGSGVPNIFNVWNDEGFVDPELEERFASDRTVLMLPFIKKRQKKVTKKTQEQYDTILSFMENGRWYKANELTELLGVKKLEDNGVTKGKTYRKANKNGSI